MIVDVNDGDLRPSSGGPVVVSLQGIFGIEERSDGNAKTRIVTAKGKVHGIINYWERKDTPGSSKVDESVELILQNSEGFGRVRFPRSLSLSDGHALLEQDVKYSLTSYEALDKSTKTDSYLLEVLSGPLSGGKLEAKVSFQYI